VSPVEAAALVVVQPRLEPSRHVSIDDKARVLALGVALQRRHGEVFQHPARIAAPTVVADRVPVADEDVAVQRHWE
jgi:hypothetical protein